MKIWAVLLGTAFVSLCIVKILMDLRKIRNKPISILIYAGLVIIAIIMLILNHLDYQLERQLTKENCRQNKTASQQFVVCASPTFTEMINNEQAPGMAQIHRDEMFLG